VKDPTSQLRSATRRAKSDVANKLVSMCLHELSRKICRDWKLSVESEEYASLVRAKFGNRCPYCLCELTNVNAVVEHLDGMNRQRAGLHVPGNVLIACKRCNSEKRRDDSRSNMPPEYSGWTAFLSHNTTHCPQKCATCRYWATIWRDGEERGLLMSENLRRIQLFRAEFPQLEGISFTMARRLPGLLTRLYLNCQAFAEKEVSSFVMSFNS
jgi:hypothetical protein